MVNRLRIDELTNSLASLLPASTGALTEDIKKNIRAVLSATLARMDLVTREEFDVQAALLARTRAKLEAMEKQIAAIEAELMKQASPPPPSKE